MTVPPPNRGPLRYCPHRCIPADGCNSLWAIKSPPGRLSNCGRSTTRACDGKENPETSINANMFPDAYDETRRKKKRRKKREGARCGQTLQTKSGKMDIARIAATLAFFPLIHIGHSTPNPDRELRPELDTLAEGGSVPNIFLHTVATSSVLYLLALLHLAENAGEPLAPIEWIVMAACLAGFAIRMWSYHSLGRHFTFTLGTRGDHVLIRSGPYAFVVHPSYTGQLTTLFGTLWFLSSRHLPIQLACIAVVVYATVTARRRAGLEEGVMLKKFGAAYKRYLATRGSFFPMSLRPGE